MKTLWRTSIVLATVAIGLGLALSSGPARAAEYPAKTIHLVVPWKAGGGTDSIARAFAEGLKSVVDVSVVVDNITGGAGLTGSIKVARAKPDGYTLLLNGTTDMTALMTFKKVPLSLDDLTYIGGVFSSPTWILAHRDRGYKDFGDFLAKAKANPGKLTLGTAGPAGAQMIMASAIKGVKGVNFRIIPYSGGADLKKALLGNQLDAGILHAPVLLAEVKAGLMKVLTTGMPLDKIVYTPVRNTKTLRDYGVPIDIGITRGIYVPKATPRPVVEKLYGIIEKAARSATYKKLAERFGFGPVWIPGPDFERQIRAELALYKDIKAKYID